MASLVSDRPPPVRIDDLAEPRFSDEARAVLDFMREAGSQLTLDPAALMAAAKSETGFDDFGAARLRAAPRPALPRHDATRAASTAPASSNSTR